jgi:hypothetical protein
VPQAPVCKALRARCRPPLQIWQNWTPEQDAAEAEEREGAEPGAPGAPRRQYESMEVRPESG